MFSRDVRVPVSVCAGRRTSSCTPSPDRKLIFPPARETRKREVTEDERR